MSWDSNAPPSSSELALANAAAQRKLNEAKKALEKANAELAAVDKPKRNKAGKKGGKAARDRRALRRQAKNKASTCTEESDIQDPDEPGDAPVARDQADGEDKPTPSGPPPPSKRESAQEKQREILDAFWKSVHHSQLRGRLSSVWDFSKPDVRTKALPMLRSKGAVLVYVGFQLTLPDAVSLFDDSGIFFVPTQGAHDHPVLHCSRYAAYILAVRGLVRDGKKNLVDIGGHKGMRECAQRVVSGDFRIFVTNPGLDGREGDCKHTAAETLVGLHAGSSSCDCQGGDAYIACHSAYYIRESTLAGLASKRSLRIITHVYPEVVGRNDEQIYRLHYKRDGTRRTLHVHAETPAGQYSHRWPAFVHGSQMPAGYSAHHLTSVRTQHVFDVRLATAVPRGVNIAACRLPLDCGQDPVPYGVASTETGAGRLYKRALAAAVAFRSGLWGMMSGRFAPMAHFVSRRSPLLDVENIADFETFEGDRVLPLPLSVVMEASTRHLHHSRTRPSWSSVVNTSRVMLQDYCGTTPVGPDMAQCLANVAYRAPVAVEGDQRSDFLADRAAFLMANRDFMKDEPGSAGIGWTAVACYAGAALVTALWLTRPVIPGTAGASWEEVSPAVHGVVDSLLDTQTWVPSLVSSFLAGVGCILGFLAAAPRLLWDGAVMFLGGEKRGFKEAVEVGVQYMGPSSIVALNAVYYAPFIEEELKRWVARLGLGYFAHAAFALLEFVRRPDKHLGWTAMAVHLLGGLMPESPAWLLHSLWNLHAVTSGAEPSPQLTGSRGRMAGSMCIPGALLAACKPWTYTSAAVALLGFAVGRPGLAAAAAVKFVGGHVLLVGALPILDDLFGIIGDHAVFQCDWTIVNPPSMPGAWAGPIALLGLAAVGFGYALWRYAPCNQAPRTYEQALETVLEYPGALDGIDSFHMSPDSQPVALPKYITERPAPWDERLDAVHFCEHDSRLRGSFFCRAPLCLDMPPVWFVENNETNERVSLYHRVVSDTPPADFSGLAPADFVCLFEGAENAGTRRFRGKFPAFRRIQYQQASIKAPTRRAPKCWHVRVMLKAEATSKSRSKMPMARIISMPPLDIQMALVPAALGLQQAMKVNTRRMSVVYVAGEDAAGIGRILTRWVQGYPAHERPAPDCEWDMGSDFEFRDVAGFDPQMTRLPSPKLEVDRTASGHATAFDVHGLSVVTFDGHKFDKHARELAWKFAASIIGELLLRDSAIDPFLWRFADSVRRCVFHGKFWTASMDTPVQCSGLLITILFNNIWTVAIVVQALRDAWGFTTHEALHQRDMLALVGGDDGLSLSRGERRLLAEHIRKAALKLGFDHDSTDAPHLANAEFYSGWFVPMVREEEQGESEQILMFCPKPGRQICKLACEQQPRALAGSLNWFRGALASFVASCGAGPFTAAYAEMLVRAVGLPGHWTGKRYSIYDAATVKASGVVFHWTDQTYEWVERRYQCDAPAILEQWRVTCDQIFRLMQCNASGVRLPWTVAFSSVVLQRLTAVDC